MWHSNDKEKSVRFVITKFGETFRDVNSIATNFQDGDSKLSLYFKINVPSSPTPDPSSSKQFVANIFVLMTGLFFAGIMFQNSRLLCALVIILSGGFLYTITFAQEDLTAVNVHIYVPR